VFQLETPAALIAVAAAGEDAAAACGLGRRPDVSQAWDAMEKALLLAAN